MRTECPLCVRYANAATLARTMAHIMARDERFEIIDLNGWRVKLGLPRHEPGETVVIPA